VFVGRVARMEVSVGLRVVEVVRWFNREYIRAFNIARW